MAAAKIQIASSSFLFLFIFFFHKLIATPAVAAVTSVPKSGLESLISRKIVEFNNTNFDELLTISRNNQKTTQQDYSNFQLNILSLSVRLSNTQAFSSIVRQLPESFFFTKTFDFYYNITMFLLESESKHLIFDLDSYFQIINMMVLYNDIACEVSQIYSNELFWIDKRGRMCFPMYATYFTDDFLRHLYSILVSKNYQPMLFIEHVFKQNADIMNYLMHVDFMYASPFQIYLKKLMF